MPRLFRSFVSGENHEVFPGNDLWEMPLHEETSALRHPAIKNQPQRNSSITIGQYLLACESILKKNDGQILNRAVQRHGVSKKIKQVYLFLEKHGAFYHPIRIEIITNGEETLSLVANGAVSSEGMALAKSENSLIERLNQSHPFNHLPDVFGYDSLQMDQCHVVFFIGEWFKGYQEFHATRKRADHIVLWDGCGCEQFVPVEKAIGIYKKASGILTDYYDIESFEQILAWHHGAGDFVVKMVQDHFKVKLITVRNYGPLFEMEKNSKDGLPLLFALFLYFLKLTMGMRLDRLDGVGEPVMLPEGILDGVVAGFCESLDEKSKSHDLGDIKDAFCSFFKQFDASQIQMAMENLLGNMTVPESEKKLIRGKSNPHCLKLFNIFENL